MGYPLTPAEKGLGVGKSVDDLFRPRKSITGKYVSNGSAYSRLDEERTSNEGFKAKLRRSGAKPIKNRYAVKGDPFSQLEKDIDRATGKIKKKFKAKKKTTMAKEQDFPRMTRSAKKKLSATAHPDKLELQRGSFKIPIGGKRAAPKPKPKPIFGERRTKPSSTKGYIQYRDASGRTTWIKR